jgi:hypothetical protein
MVKGDDKKIICIGDKPLSSVDAKPLKLVAEASISDADDDDDGGDSNGDSCEFEVPTKISADAVDSRRNASLDVNVDVCDINIRVVIPLCSSRQLQVSPPRHVWCLRLWHSFYHCFIKTFIQTPFMNALNDVEMTFSAKQICVFL